MTFTLFPWDLLVNSQKEFGSYDDKHANQAW